MAFWCRVAGERGAEGNVGPLILRAPVMCRISAFATVQMAVLEAARNMAGVRDAVSSEFGRTGSWSL